MAKQGSESVATKKEKREGWERGISSYKRGEKVKGGKGAELHIGYSYLYNTNRLVRTGRRINLPVLIENFGSQKDYCRYFTGFKSTGTICLI